LSRSAASRSRRWTPRSSITRKEIRNTLFRSIANSRTALVHHVIRRAVRVDLGGTFPDAFSAELDRRRREDWSRTRSFVNEHVLVIVRRGLRGPVGRLERWSRGSGARSMRAPSASATRRSARRSRRRWRPCFRVLEPYGARRLGTYRAPHGTCSEVLEFLSYLLHHEVRPVLLSPLGVDRYLPQKRITFGRDVLEIRGAVEADVRFGRCWA
jgi:type IV secretion system protein VirB4